MKHLMIDLETMGTRFDAPVVAIGAVYFDPDTGALGETFYRHIDVHDACRYGKVAGNTIVWWMKQSDAARGALTREDGLMAVEAFTDFQAFVLGGTKGKDVCVWGNGATFDISILEYAFLRIIDRAAPWQFWNVRDCRTIKDVAWPLGVKVQDLQGTAHNALDDAVHQAKWVSALWQALRGKKAEPAPLASEDDGLIG